MTSTTQRTAALLVAFVATACATPAPAPDPPPAEATAEDEPAIDEAPPRRADSEPTPVLAAGIVADSPDGMTFRTSGGVALPLPDDIAAHAREVGIAPPDDPTLEGSAVVVIDGGDPPSIVDWRCVSLTEDCDTPAKVWQLHGTEPFWALRITDEGALWTDPVQVDGVEFQVADADTDASWTLVDANTGQRVEVVLADGPCSDGMADALWHRSVRIEFASGASYEGCAESPSPR